jgi:phage terminase large subunit-like protein
MSNVGWRLLKELARQIPGAQVRESERTITLPGKGTIGVRSADNPDSLRGEGLDFVAMDECAFTREEAWTASLRPALADRQGSAVFISTPLGRNWFWRMYQAAIGGEPGWAAWQLPTSDNPYIVPTEIEAARKLLPERIFQQEFMAQFLEDSGALFRRVTEAATATEIGMQPGHEYVMGVDWGKHDDFTVLAVLDTGTHAMVYMDRFAQIDYQVQLGRLKALYERYCPGTIIAEANSMGEPLIEQCTRMGLPVQPFVTTNATKTAAIDALALAFEQGDIKILNDPILIGELQAYEMERLPSGLMRYNAPEGMHDDTVMSLALAYQGLGYSGSWITLI